MNKCTGEYLLIQLRFLRPIICLLICLYSNGYSKNWETWQIQTFSGQLFPKMTATVQTEFRLGDDMKKFYYQHTHFELSYPLISWLAIAPAYRQTYTRIPATVDTGFKVTFMPMINLTGKYSWKGIVFSDRIRLVRISEENEPDVLWRFQNRSVIRFPAIIQQGHICPVLAEELFVLKERNGLYRHREVAGFEMQPLEKIVLSFVYLFDEELDRPKKIHALGLYLQFIF